MQKDNYNKTIFILLAIIVIESVFLIFSYQRKEKPSLLKPKRQALITPKAAAGKLAIVLDDWGYSLVNVELLKEIKDPLTLAILPNRVHTGDIVRVARELKKETILHLPLEPHQEQKNNLEPNTILVNMAKQDVLRILMSALKSVPGIKGISNHMGSYATENVKLMKIIFGELKKRRLFFLDSFTGKSICRDAAGSLGLRYARRQVFLDNQADTEYILGQLEELARIAKQQGFAIGIGHDRTNTLTVLLKAMPDLKKRGFKFVYVSQLVQ